MKKVRAEMTIMDTVGANQIENERQYQWLAQKKKNYVRQFFFIYQKLFSNINSTCMSDSFHIHKKEGRRKKMH